ncbi:P-loop NTPase fold protein [Haloimpatiens sp. FM7315]|uniref:P-loop NTPase fold protein n=1 Tax=Haloimpatiens sp. FM7315 TaxID=3298609 RepID=UPI00370BDB57
MIKKLIIYFRSEFYYFILGLIFSVTISIIDKNNNLKNLISKNIYLFIWILILLFLAFSLKYKLTKNYNFIEKVSGKIIDFGCFLLAFLLPIDRLCININKRFNESYKSFIAIFIVIIIFVIIKFTIKKRCKTKNINNDEKLLYKKRQCDLKKVKEEMKIFKTLGINSQWGVGKTFFINKLFEELINDNNEIIKVNVLSYKDRDELRSFLLDQIQRILKKNRIVPINVEYVTKYLNFIKGTLKIDLSSIFSVKSKDNFNELQSQYSNEILELDKNIIIILDDIDRISDSEKIKSIFGFLYDIIQFENEKIKIIFLYDQFNFDKVNISEEYLDKFIETKISLSKLQFNEIIIEECEGKDYLDKFNSLMCILDDIKIYDYLSKQLGKDLKNKEFNTYDCSKWVKEYILKNESFGNPRKVNKFINKAIYRINSNLYIEIDEYLIIAFTFIEIFKAEIFNKFQANSLNENMLDEYFNDIERNDKLFYELNIETLFLRLLLNYKYNFSDDDKVKEEKNKIQKSIYKMLNLNEHNITDIEDFCKRIEDLFLKELNIEEKYKKLSSQLSLCPGGAFYIGEKNFFTIRRNLYTLEKDNEYEKLFQVYVELIFFAYKIGDITLHDLFVYLNFDRILNSKELFYKVIKSIINLNKIEKVEDSTFKSLIDKLLNYWCKFGILWNNSWTIDLLLTDYLKNKSIRINIMDFDKNKVLDETFEKIKKEVELFNTFLEKIENIYDSKKLSRDTTQPRIEIKTKIVKSKEYENLVKKINQISNENKGLIKKEILSIGSIREEMELGELYKKRLEKLGDN